MLTTLVRVIRYGVKNFLRNGSLSAATVAVMLLALSFFLGLIIFRFITITTLDAIKDKIDISVYFKLSAPEDEILRIKRSLEGLEQVKGIVYVSRDDALATFKQKHQNDAAAQALDELSDNPFLPSLNVKANDPSEYSNIASYLENESFNSVIAKVTFAQNQIVIERLTNIIETANRSGLALTFVFSIIAILVAFNTIWLAMYSNREEFGIMRLVGASNPYIRGPYIVEGIIYGIVAALLSIVIAVPIVLIAGPWAEKITADVSLETYFFTNIFKLVFYQLLFGVVLGGLSSFIAIRRYLKV